MSMKFVVYKDQKKIVIDNAWAEEMEDFQNFMYDAYSKNKLREEEQVLNMQITSLNGKKIEDGEIEDFDNEEMEVGGIDWSQETVN